MSKPEKCFVFSLVFNNEGDLSVGLQPHTTGLSLEFPEWVQEVFFQMPELERDLKGILHDIVDPEATMYTQEEWDQHCAALGQVYQLNEYSVRERDPSSLLDKG